MPYSFTLRETCLYSSHDAAVRLYCDNSVHNILYALKSSSILFREGAHVNGLCLWYLCVGPGERRGTPPSNASTHVGSDADGASIAAVTAMVYCRVVKKSVV